MNAVNFDLKKNEKIYFLNIVQMLEPRHCAHFPFRETYSIVIPSLFKVECEGKCKLSTLQCRHRLPNKLRDEMNGSSLPPLTGFGQKNLLLVPSKLSIN